jgi:hypothetical protein
LGKESGEEKSLILSLAAMVRVLVVWPIRIQMCPSDLALRLIERETRGYKAVLGMDLTYELVAHIFIGDRLFGILTEPSHLARPFRGVSMRFGLCSHRLNLLAE